MGSDGKGIEEVQVSDGIGEDPLAKKAPEEYACPMCRIEHVDEFHLPVGPQILRFAYTSANATISLPFQSQVAHWRKRQWNVHLRAVSLNQGTLGGPTWPHRVVAKLNGRQCVNIEPPKHLHVRREQCYNLTPLVRQGLNSLELRLSPNPERPRDQPEEDFCIAAVLTKPRTVAAMVASIRGASKETVETGKQRVGKILASTASAAKKTEDECIVSGDFGRKMKPVCPLFLPHRGRGSRQKLRPCAGLRPPVLHHGEPENAFSRQAVDLPHLQQGTSAERRGYRPLRARDSRFLEGRGGKYRFRFVQ